MLNNNTPPDLKGFGSDKGVVSVEGCPVVAQRNVLSPGKQLSAEELYVHLTAIVESSDDAILSKDLNGVIQSWNKGAERIFGYTSSEVIGKPVTILIPEGRQNEEPAILARIRKGERVDHYETIRQRKDGGLVHISLCISPIKMNGA